VRVESLRLTLWPSSRRLCTACPTSSARPARRLPLRAQRPRWRGRRCGDGGRTRLRAVAGATALLGGADVALLATDCGAPPWPVARKVLAASPPQPEVDGGVAQRLETIDPAIPFGRVQASSFGWNAGAAALLHRT
jgi:hypothetical protein